MIPFLVLFLKIFEKTTDIICCVMMILSTIENETEHENKFIYAFCMTSSLLYSIVVLDNKYILLSVCSYLIVL